MWIFIFVLAMVPLFFYLSDSVTTVLPALSKYLPEKNNKGAGSPGGLAALNAAQPGQVVRWTQSSTDAGYVAWLMSSDGQYRLAVGCRKGAPASLQVTQGSGKPVADQLVLDFHYGRVTLTQGMYGGSDLVGAVAQFDAVDLQQPVVAATPQTLPLTVARFSADRRDSGLMARSLQQYCR